MTKGCSHDDRFGVEPGCFSLPVIVGRDGEVDCDKEPWVGRSGQVCGDAVWRPSVAFYASVLCYLLNRDASGFTEPEALGQKRLA